MEGFYRSTSHRQFLWFSTGENTAQDLQSRFNLLGANAEWGAKANGAIPGAQEQEFARHAVRPVYCAPPAGSLVWMHIGGVAERLKAHAWKVCRR